MYSPYSTTCIYINFIIIELILFFICSIVTIKQNNIEFTSSSSVRGVCCELNVASANNSYYYF